MKARLQESIDEAVSKGLTVRQFLAQGISEVVLYGPGALPGPSAADRWSGIGDDADAYVCNVMPDGYVKDQAFSQVMCVRVMKVTL